MSHTEITRLLVSLGLPRESATLYLHLLEDGPLSLPDLLQKTGLAEEKAFPLLGRLLAIRLIFEDSGRYWVLNPRKSFKAFADEVLWSVTSTLSDDLKDVPLDQVSYVQSIRETCQLLMSLVSERYHHRSPIAVGRIRVARDSDQLAAFLVEAIDSAREEIVCVSTSPRQPQLSVIWRSLSAKIKEGVRYTRIVDLAEVIEHGFAIVQRDIEEVGVNLYIAERDRIDRKFYVIDDTYVVMFTPRAYEFTLTGQAISNKLIVGDYRKAFAKLLSDAIPATFVLRLMGEQRSSLLASAAQKMSSTEIRWLECLLDFGIYCKFLELDAGQLPLVIERAKEQGIVEVAENGSGEIVPLPKYSWSIEGIREAWTATGQQL